MGLRMEFSPTEKKNLGILLHSLSTCILTRLSRAVLERADKLRQNEKKPGTRRVFLGAGIPRKSELHRKLGGLLCAQVLFRKEHCAPISSIPVKSRTVARSPNFRFLLTIHFDFRLSLGNRSRRHSRRVADPYLLGGLPFAVLSFVRVPHPRGFHRTASNSPPAAV